MSALQLTKAPFIRVIAICLFRHDDRILVFEGFDEVKGTHFYRPLGGGVDVGVLALLDSGSGKVQVRAGEVWLLPPRTSTRTAGAVRWREVDEVPRNSLERIALVEVHE